MSTEHEHVIPSPFDSLRSLSAGSREGSGWAGGAKPCLEAEDAAKLTVGEFRQRGNAAVPLVYHPDVARSFPAVPLLLLALASGCGQAPGRAESAPSPAPPPACVADADGPYPVTHIGDGDSISVRANGKQIRVRLIGVDAPEVDGPHRRAEKGGPESRAFVRSFLQGESVYLESDIEQGTTDQHGRRLAYAYRARDCALINGEIIRQGYAEGYRRFRYRHKELFAGYEQEARISRRGMWK